MFSCIYLFFIFISSGTCLAGFIDGLAQQVSQGIISGLGLGGNDNVAKLRIYQTSLEDYSEIPLNNAIDICSNPFFNSTRRTKILVHGFNAKPDTGTAITTIMETYLDQEKFNVVLLNWAKLSADIYNNVELSYIRAARNAMELGSDFADALISLSEVCLDLNLLHPLGHSLGAHVVGIAGNKMVQKGKKLRRVTGLDPAGNIFNFVPSEFRINPMSAGFVDVIHTDPDNYGTDKAMGTVDYYPNFTPDKYVDQPGCDHSASYPKFSDKDLCNHNRCWRYMLETLYSKYPRKVLGSYSTDYDSWQKSSQAQRNASEILEMGRYYSNAKPGKYFLTTNAASPFGRGLDGI